MLENDGNKNTTKKQNAIRVIKQNLHHLELGFVIKEKH